MFRNQYLTGKLNKIDRQADHENETASILMLAVHTADTWEQVIESDSGCFPGHQSCHSRQALYLRIDDAPRR
jgi:hypothetical protein